MEMTSLIADQLPSGAGEAETRQEVNGQVWDQHRYLSLLAEFDNYRRRMKREHGKAARAGKRELLLPLLEVLDNFERALEQPAVAPSMLEGFRSIYKQILSFLKAQGIECLACLGQPFDPNLHEAVSVATGHQSAGTVVEVVRPGYRWGKELLRPARVVVSK